MLVVKVYRFYFFYSFQLHRSPDNGEAQDQLMRANELEELQEEAHAAYHQGDYSATISVLERVIEVCITDGVKCSFGS